MHSKRAPWRHCSVVPCAFLYLLASPARATEVGTSRTFGLGVQIGDSTGVVAKAFLGSNTAFDFGLGFGGWEGRGRCHAGLD